ncbi:MAG: 4-alpha-glucanotransferase [Rhodospirillales bacterium]|nr:4-alpha-glucanotransferase [Rhodospirillales bacterium]
MAEADEAMLARLAALAGIVPFYRDTEGRLRTLAPATRAGVLRALGHDSESPGAVRDAVAALEAAPWRSALPPMAVLPSPPAAPELALVVAERAIPGFIVWRIVQEDGIRREGRVASEHLPVRQRAPREGRLRLALPLPGDLPPGYHRVEIAAGSVSATCSLVRPPPRAWHPDWLARGEREWGIGAALFALWSGRSWGIGDFGDLARFAELAGGWGARVIGLNPLHAPMPGAVADPNPYRPSSRQFLNPLHLDLAALRSAAPMPWPPPDAGVDYALVYARKHAALAAVFQAGTWDAAGFAAFREAGGMALERFALFNALAERFAPHPWRAWPEALRGPDAPGIAAFRREAAARIAYHAWLQWIAEAQLARAAGAGAGLYRDLALGVDPDGAELWAEPDQFLAGGARIGAPPDAFSPGGQDWGLPPPDPRALAASGYAGFRAVLRANLRHAAALRVDHVMGLDRLYVIPAGATAAEGAYLRYPREDLLGILTLESHRQRCLLVGEDLGTVPEGLRERLAAAGILSTRLLLFERWSSGLFRRPGCYPRLSLAAFATHDLPSFRGWWDGSDLPSEAEATRQQDREWLLAALRDRGLGPEGVEAVGRLDPAAVARLLAAMHAFLGRGPSALVLASLGDLLAETAQINQPGLAGSANWRHRYRVPLETLDADPMLDCILAALTAARTEPAETDV